MSWTPTLPRDIEKLKDTPSQIRAMWAEIATGTDPALLITNDKISPTANIADTKLAQIATAGKVSGAAITLLASIPSGAGQIPIANIPNLAASKITSGTLDIERLPYGTTANKLVKLDNDAKLPAIDGSLLTNILPSNLSIASQARGDLLYFNGSIWTRLGKGTIGQILKQGTNDPEWGSITQMSAVSDIDTGTALGASNWTTFLSVNKTITSGNTVLLIASGWCDITTSDTQLQVDLRYGSTTAQIIYPYYDKDGNWSVSALVTGLSGSITFSVRAQPNRSGATIYGNLSVLEF